MSESRQIRIAHLNDHYELDLAARFAARLRALRIDGRPEGPPLLLHSGDCFAPSLLSVMTKVGFEGHEAEGGCLQSAGGWLLQGSAPIQGCGCTSLQHPATAPHALATAPDALPARRRPPQGRQMQELLGLLGVAAACVGNHDLVHPPALPPTAGTPTHPHDPPTLPLLSR